MPSLKTLLQLPCGWQTIRQTTASGGVTIYLQATRKTGHFPECMKSSTSVHSRRRRRIQHLPCSGQTIWLIFAVRHWYCQNQSCSRKIFAESLEPFAGPRQQASQPLQKLQHQLGLIAGGEVGRRAATAAGLRTSADEHVLLFGSSGLGKSHLAAAIVDGIVAQGYRARFYSAGELLQELRKARAQLKLNELLLKLDRYRVIVVDAPGYVKRDNAETGVLFELIVHRYERGSLVITSNHPSARGAASSWMRRWRWPLQTG